MKQKSTKIDLDEIDLLLKDTKKDTVVLYTKLISICKTFNGMVMLSLIINHWREQGKFYRFQTPCNHELYLKGESWQEMTGFSRKVIRTALNSIAIKRTVKNRESNEVKNAIVIYYTDKNRLTWYELNVKELNKRIKSIGIGLI